MFLTRVPVCHLADHDPVFLARSTAFWPFIGALLGLAAGGVFVLLSFFDFPPLFCAIAALATTAILTGCFHEDAFSDVCDGFGGYTPQKRLEIMRDSRVGSFGVWGSLFLAGAMAALLAEFSPKIAIGALVLAHALGRWSSVLLVWRMDYVNDGASLAKPFAANVSGGVFGVSTLFCAAISALIFAFLLPKTAIFAAPLLVIFFSLGAARWFRGWLGGLSGDALGATNLACQLLVLALVFQLFR